MDSPDLAVVGAGQLARMMQPPAIELGLRLRLLAEAADASAAQVISDHVVGDYTNLDDLRAGVDQAPVVTFDHEHVPTEHLRALAADGQACRPGPDALIFAQDKGEMRVKLSLMGVPCPIFEVLDVDADDTIDDLADAMHDFGYPAVLKTTRGGYDGKGVWVVRSGEDLAEPLAAGQELIAEELVEFTRELSVLVARSPSGEVVDYPIVESTQRDGVCAEVIAPAPGLDEELEHQALAIARQIAAELDVTGILAVEMFETADGRVLVNELAMRPHNTGHWTIDGALTSQFENHLRAVLDLPLGPTEQLHPWSVMVNVLGGSITDLDAQRAVVWRQDPTIAIHLYGKQVKPGRKVGHVTASGGDLDEVLTRARAAAALLTDG